MSLLSFRCFFSFHNFLQILACKKKKENQDQGQTKQAKNTINTNSRTEKKKLTVLLRSNYSRHHRNICPMNLSLYVFLNTFCVFKSLMATFTFLQPSRPVKARRTALCCLRCDDPWCHPGVLIRLLTCISARSAGDWLAGASGTNYGAWCVWDYVSPDCSLIIVTLSAGSPRSAFGSVASVYLHVLSCTLKTPTSSTHAHHTLTLLFWLFNLILTS